MKTAFTLILVFLLSSFALAQSNDYVVVVLDASGSMDRKFAGVQKMEAAKTALSHVLEQVPDSTYVGILVFSSSGKHNEWLYPISRKDSAKLAGLIQLPKPGNGTPLGEYIKKGADALLEEREKQHGYGTYRLLVVTDGEATDGNLTEMYSPEVVARGIMLDVIGVDMKTSHTLAKMAHSYRSADNPESLKQAVAEVFAEVSDKQAMDADNSAFEMIQGLPDDSIMPIITALSTSGNYPIGEKPRISQPVQQQETQQQTPAQQSGGGIGKILIIFAVIIGIIIIGVMLKQ